MQLNLQFIKFEKIFAMDPKQQFLDRIKKNQNKFSANDRKVADYLVYSYPGGLLETASEMAKELNISISTVTRFFPKIGFKSIKEAQKEFRHDYDYLKNSPLDRFHQKKVESDAGDTLLDKTRDLDISNIQETFQGIDGSEIEKFVEYVCQEDKTIYIVGGRKMSGVSHYLSIQLKSLHPRVIEVNTDPSMIADSVVNVQGGDTLILFDFRRYMKVSKRLISVFNKVDGRIVVITDSPISPCVGSADAMFQVKTKGASIFDSYTAVYFLINALLAEVTLRYGKKVKQKYEKLEEYYKLFDVFYRP